jgi:hypothetical protein
MLKIAEIKVIDNEVWVRIPMEMGSGVGLYTEEEIAEIRRDERRACADLILGDEVE